MRPFYGTGIPVAGTYLYALEGAPMHAKAARMQVDLDFGTAGGTLIKNFLQTSFDDGRTWQDIMNLEVGVADLRVIGYVNRNIVAAVQNPATDGTLAANTIINGLFGAHWRLKQIITGTYHADNILRIDVNFESN